MEIRLIKLYCFFFFVFADRAHLSFVVIFLCENVTMCSAKSLYLTFPLYFVAHNVTIEEILSSYKQACQKLNCKPIPKVLKQIQVSFTYTQINSTWRICNWNKCESITFEAAISKWKGLFLTWFIRRTKCRFQIIVGLNVLPVSHLTDHRTTVLQSLDSVVAWERFECPPWAAERVLSKFPWSTLCILWRHLYFIFCFQQNLFC